MRYQRRAWGLNGSVFRGFSSRDSLPTVLGCRLESQRKVWKGGRGVVAVITKKDWMGGVTFYPPSSSCYNSYTLCCSHLPHLCLWSPLLPFHCHFINLSNQCPCQTQTMKANSRLNIWEVCQSGQRKEGALLKIDLWSSASLSITS